MIRIINNAISCNAFFTFLRYSYKYLLSKVVPIHRQTEYYVKINFSPLGFITSLYTSSKLAIAQVQAFNFSLICVELLVVIVGSCSIYLILSIYFTGGEG